MNLLLNFQRLKKSKKIIELFLLFVLTPLLLLLSSSIRIKITYLFLAIAYIFAVSIRKKSSSSQKKAGSNRVKILVQIGVRFIIIAIGTTLILFFQEREALFNVMLNKPFLWLKFNAVYVLVSVIPQEFIYRTFFTKRYQKLINNEFFFILLNAALFSLAHIWFRSWVVLGFTFVGGILFIKTYLKTKSVWLVIIEHSIYGVWLYTVGYGKIFMFPV